MDQFIHHLKSVSSKLITHYTSQQRQAFYQALEGKSAGQATQNDLLAIVHNFISSTKQALLLLGDAGSGKTLFCQQLMSHYWQTIEQNKVLPVYINLTATTNLQHDLISQSLEQMGFSQEQITFIRNNFRLLCLFDSYDALGQYKNLYVTQQLVNWRAKAIITCRKLYLSNSADHAIYFAPIKQSRRQSELLQQVSIVSFSQANIQAYINAYTSNQPLMNSQSICALLLNNPELKQLVTNPLWLRLMLEFIKQHGVKAGISIAELMQPWFTYQERKLKQQGRIANETSLITEAWHYCQALASCMEEQQSNSISYRPQSQLFTNTSNPWAQFFDSTNSKTHLLLALCPLRTDAKFQYGFMAKSMNNLFLQAKPTPSIPSQKPRVEQISQSVVKRNVGEELLKHPLNTRSIIENESLLQFFVSRIQQQPNFKLFLLSLIHLSRQNPAYAIAAANAITILNKARISFSNMDLSRINIPNANLNQLIARETNFSGANLANCSFYSAYLAKSMFDEANLQQAKLGEAGYLTWGTGCVTSLCFSADGQCLIAAGDDNIIAVYDVETGEKLKSFAPHKQRVSSVTLSSDGKYILSTSKDKTIRLTNFATAVSTIIAEVSGHDRLGITYESYFPATFSPDDQNIVFAQENMLGGFELKFVAFNCAVKQSNTLAISGMGHIVQIHYSKTGNLLGITIGHSYDSATVQIWDISQQRCRTFKAYWFCFSPDEQQLALAAINNDGLEIVEIYNLPHFQRQGYFLSPHVDAQHSVNYVGTIRNMRFILKNGRRILAVSGDDSDIYLWDVLEFQPEPVARLTGHTAPITCLAYLPAKDLLASATGSLKLVGDGSGDRTIRFWDIAHILSLKINSDQHRGEVYALAVAPMQKVIFTAGQDGSIKAWSAENGTLLGSFQPYQEENLQEIAALTLIPNRATEDHSIQLIVINVQNKLKQLEYRNGVFTIITTKNYKTLRPLNLAVSPSGAHLAIGNHKEAELIDLNTWQPLSLNYSIPATNLIFSPSLEQEVIALVGNNLLTVLNGLTGEVIFKPTQLEYKHAVGLGALAFFPKNAWKLASAHYDEANDIYIYLWDLKVKSSERLLLPCKQSIQALCFSPDEKFLVAGDEHGVIYIFDIMKNKLALIIEDRERTQAVSISKIYFIDENHFCCTRIDGSIEAWTLTNKPQDNELSVQLKWHISSELVVRNASFNGVKSLSSRDWLTLKNKNIQLPKAEDKIAIQSLEEGRFWLSQNQVRLALSKLSHAINVNPKMAAGYLERGKCFYKLQDFKRAEEDYTQAVAQSEEMSIKIEAYYWRSKLYEICQMADRALEDLQQAQQLCSESEIDAELRQQISEKFQVLSEKKRIKELFATCQKDVFAFEQLFKPTDVTNKDEHGLTLLHHAIYFQQEAIVQLLLANGANPLTESKNGGSALHYAITVPTVNLNIIRTIAEVKPAIIHTIDNKGYTPLHYAVNISAYEAAEYLLARGADVNARVIGLSPCPLIVAVKSLDCKMIELLLSYQADYTITSSLGKTPVFLLQQMVFEQLDLLTLNPGIRLSEEKRDKAKRFFTVNQLFLKQMQKDGVGGTLDFDTVAMLHKLLTRWLEPEKQVELSISNNEARSSIEGTSIFRGIFSTAPSPLEKVLSKYKFAKDLAVPTKEVALRRAAAQGCNQDIELLLKHGANINAQDDNPQRKRTALHQAAIFGQQETLGLLLKFGAQDMPDAFGKLAKDYLTTRSIGLNFG